MRRILIVIALLSVVLTACRIETNVGFDIAADGSATITMEVGVDDEFKNLIESSGGSIDDMLAEGMDGLDGDVETRTDGDMTYYQTSTHVDDLSAWDSSSMGEGDMFSAFSFGIDGDIARFDVAIEGAAESDFGDLGFDPSTLTGDLFSANLIVNMPGAVTEHNADEIRDGALVWILPIGGSVDAHAESNLSGSSSSWIWILLAVILVIAVVAALLAVALTKNSSKKAVEAAIAEHEAKKAAEAAETTETTKGPDEEE
ncbi:MAG: hypothetical protein KDB69_00560 [Acidimicrobiia bacterium]|nr:hypothetical protein [Acidimicrobiia bacterium]